MEASEIIIGQRYIIGTRGHIVIGRAVWKEEAGKPEVRFVFTDLVFEDGSPYGFLTDSFMASEIIGIFQPDPALASV